jgi:hypothetical protein
LRREIEIRAHQDETVLAIDDQHETDAVLDGLPEQIDAEVLDSFEFSADCELRLLEQVGKVEDVRERTTGQPTSGSVSGFA